jgi:hypothetical protein
VEWLIDEKVLFYWLNLQIVVGEKKSLWMREKEALEHVRRSMD